MVVLAELFRRLKQKGFVAVFWSPGKDKSGVSDVLPEADYVYEDRESVYRQIEGLANDNEIVLGADRKMVVSGELLELKEQLSGKALQPITTILIDTAGEGMDAEIPYGPLDTSLQFDIDLAARGYFPAVNPVLSTSVLLEGMQVESKHMVIQQRARKLLRRYKELRALARVRGLKALPDTERLIYNRGERLEAYLTQPLFVAEDLTKTPGVWVPKYDALESIRKIVDGTADNIAVDNLQFIGQLEDTTRT